MQTMERVNLMYSFFIDQVAAGKFFLFLFSNKKKANHGWRVVGFWWGNQAIKVKIGFLATQGLWSLLQHEQKSVLSCRTKKERKEKRGKGDLVSRVWLISGRASSVLGQLCGKWPPEKVLGSVSFVSRCLDLPTRPQGFPDHLTNCRTIRLIVRLFSCAPLWTPVSTCLSAVRTPPPPPPHPTISCLFSTWPALVRGF